MHNIKFNSVRKRLSRFLNELTLMLCIDHLIISSKSQIFALDLHSDLAFDLNIRWNPMLSDTLSQQFSKIFSFPLFSSWISDLSVDQGCHDRQAHRTFDV